MRRRRRHSLRRRYGRAVHPLFPRLVMELRKHGPNRFTIVGKLKRGYHTEWENVFYRDVESPPSVAREELRRITKVVASERGVPPSHVEVA